VALDGFCLQVKKARPS